MGALFELDGVIGVFLGGERIWEIGFWLEGLGFCGGIRVLCVLCTETLRRY